MGMEGFQLPKGLMEAAYDAMDALEAGAIANPDEGRQVGHYWLRDPDRAPDGLGEAIRAQWDAVQDAADGAWGVFTDFLLVGIGGSALGPQLLADALGPSGRGLRPRFLDNTDPDGIERTLAQIEPARTLVVVVSKSGGTQETRNAMLEVRAAYDREGVDFAPRAIAVTGQGSSLDRLAEAEGWRARLPMWDWVGGRTSVTAAVGLLPLALMGQDWRAFLEGAAACDAVTRQRRPDNPAALLARAWYAAGDGHGRRAMVLLPYKDRLLLFSRYLQQLVMESLGKRLDLQGRAVHQGLTVYGNKGSTDQHAYVQQLRDGPDDFFVTFIAALVDREGPDLEVEPGITTGDYLLGFLLGTRRALSEAGRRSLTLVVERVDARTLGVLVALYERAVGLYASLIGINAYHQPGVEAGKRAAADVLQLQARLLAGEPVEPDDDVALLTARLRALGRWKRRVGPDT
ncbi:MAG: glucose-6-phosphate isomerase [Alphaproteobacteria bacterium]|nr:glucose-6-phosphate isomerase [Alphaproteobacteria bacterium]